MAKRKSTGKRLRFEIFKRDNFTCQYCGKQPPEVVLVIDHVTPVSAGGDNDPMNLMTACETCNQGKSDKVLGSVSPKPDADLEWLAMQQEIAELRRYQIAKKERDRITCEIISMLQDTWSVCFNDEYVPSDFEIRKSLSWSEPDEIEKAFTIAASRSYRIKTFGDRYRYAMGVLHKLVEERQNAVGQD